MTGGAMAGRDDQVREIQAQFPGWEVWQSLDGWWHARVVGAVPPVMVHATSPGELAGLIHEQAT